MIYQIDNINYTLNKFNNDVIDPLLESSISIISLSQVTGKQLSPDTEFIYILLPISRRVFLSSVNQLPSALLALQNIKIICFDFASIYWKTPQVWQNYLERHKTIFDIGILYSLYTLASEGTAKILPSPQTPPLETDLTFSPMNIPFIIHKQAILAALNIFTHYNSLTQKIESLFETNSSFKPYQHLNLSYSYQLKATLALNKISHYGIGFSDEKKIEYLNSPSITEKEKNALKLIQNFQGPRIHTTFTPLVSTGRTSSHSPNIQGIAKIKTIRNCFPPQEGYRYFTADYSIIELRALAQICADNIPPFGTIKAMGKLLNNGIDLHSWLASKIYNKPIFDISKSERAIGKACNFGFAGGMGIETFRELVKKEHCYELTTDQAKKLKEIWLNTFPEMKTYLKDHLLKKYEDIFSSSKGFYNFKNIFLNKTQIYTIQEKEWAVQTVLPRLAPHLPKISIPHSSLWNLISKETFITRSGRIRSGASYTESKNAKFQGLAADGAKLALYNLVIKNNYRVVNFIHDEVLIEIPINECTEETSQKIIKIMVDSMKHVIPQIEIKVEGKFIDNWGD